jgi:hypothetical protein
MGTCRASWFQARPKLAQPFEWFHCVVSFTHLFAIHLVALPNAPCQGMPIWTFMLVPRPPFQFIQVQRNLNIQNS